MYASEEQLAGEKPHPTDDVHALGVMLYQMILGDTNRPLNRDWHYVLGRLHACDPLMQVVARSIASDKAARFRHAGELAEALRSLPKKLIVEPVVISQVNLDKQLYADIDAKVADATTKTATAQRHLDRREWPQAATALESIFHPAFRPADLYDRATAFRDGKKSVNGLGMEFALVPKGTFWMGGGDGKCGDKQVTIEQDFHMGVYPVTQEEWQAIMGTNPSHFRKGGGGADKLSGISDGDLKRFPVESISWNDCQVFIQKLNEKLKDAGYRYCLPTEAQWEYACRGAATTQEGCSWNYYFQTPTNTLNQQQANTSEAGLGRTTKVGSYKPNSLGLYDMHGNISEWGAEWSDSKQKYCILRGGAWNHVSSNSRAGYRRFRYDPSDANDGSTGFRLCFSLDR
jgi:formylglycine-generating enzyme required for sulfatase activity